MFFERDVGWLNLTGLKSSLSHEAREVDEVELEGAVGLALNIALRYMVSFGRSRWRARFTQYASFFLFHVSLAYTIKPLHELDCVSTPHFGRFGSVFVS